MNSYNPARAAVIVLLLAFAPAGEPRQPQEANPQALAGFTEEELARFSKRFEAEIWPLLTRNRKSCVNCHDRDSESQLHLIGEPAASFKRLLVEGRLDPKGPASLLTRLTTSDKKKRMPRPQAPAWTDAEVALLKDFGTELHQLQRKDGVGMDERFPMELLAEYRGK